jgi:hypothetical protein
MPFFFPHCHCMFSFSAEEISGVPIRIDAPLSEKSRVYCDPTRHLDSSVASSIEPGWRASGGDGTARFNLFKSAGLVARLSYSCGLGLSACILGGPWGVGARAPAQAALPVPALTRTPRPERSKQPKRTERGEQLPCARRLEGESPEDGGGQDSAATGVPSGSGCAFAASVRRAIRLVTLPPPPGLGTTSRTLPGACIC